MASWILAAAAAAFWGGIVLGGTDPPRPAALGLGLLFVGLMVLAAAARRTWPRTNPRAAIVRLVLVTLAFASLGGGWSVLRAARLHASPIARLDGRSVEIVGALSADPQPGSLGWTVTANVSRLRPDTPGWPAEVAVHDAVWAEGRGRPPELDAGDRVAMTGLLRMPAGAFGDYLRHRGYAGELSVGTLRLLGPPTNPMLVAADALRGALTTSLGRVFPAREAGLLMGLALGDVSRLDPIVAERFRATGLTHLLAVSGENVAMFLAPIMALASFLRLRRSVTFGIGVAAVVFFVVLTRAEPSVLRAAAMTSLVMVGSFIGRPRTAPAIVGGAVLALLAVNPTLVYAIGFQLSVAATVGIAALTAPIAARLRWLPGGLATAAGTTIGAQAGVTPLLLHYFGSVPTVTLAANLLAAPAVGPGMVLGLVAAAIGVVWHTGGGAVAWIACIPIDYLEAVAAHLARWPLPSLTAQGGRPLEMVAGFALVGSAAVWLRSGIRPSGRALLSVAAALALLTAASAVRAGPPHALTITFFDVGQGDSALVRSPGGATLLIDGGPDPEQVATKLAALGVHRLDVLVATHPHADHVAGLPAVLARVPVGVVLDPGCYGPSPFYAAFLSAVSASGDPVRHPRAGETIRVADLTLQILGPEHCAHGTDSDPNNDSIVLRLRDGPDTVLFSGDAEVAEQTEVLRDERALLAATVLKVPHHGGDTSLPGFVAATRAAVAVVSVGPNHYGHPVPGVLAGLRRDGMRVFRTDRSGDVTVTFDGGTAVSVQSSGHG